jgi:GNAT superfamily N-acetyltransferase
MIIKTATPENAPEIVQLVNSAYRGDEAKAGWTTEADLIDGLRIDLKQVLEMIHGPNSLIDLGFDEEGRILSTVYLKFEGTNTCYLGMLTVNPKLQARGTGKILLTHAEDFAKKKGCNEMKITVLTFRDTLISFYERRGYVKTGKVHPFAKHAGHVGTPKVPNLAFLEMVKRL